MEASFAAEPTREGSHASRPDRQKLRERERKSRERRALIISKQRATLELYETDVGILPSVYDDDDALWNSLLEPAAAKIRNHLGRSMLLAQEQKRLEHDRAVLNRLYQEHRLASIAIESMLGVVSNDWEASIRRWRAITLRYFKPWTMEDCQEEIETSQKELNAFLWSLDTASMGVNFFGWRARTRIVGTRDAVQFSFEKTLRGFPMMDFVDVAWQSYTDYKSYDEVIVGTRGIGWADVLQKVTPKNWLVRCVERYPSFSLDTHMVYLVSRVATENGFTQFVRSVSVPEIQKKTSKPSDMWASNFVWIKCDALNQDATDYRIQIGGKLSGQDCNYAAQWLMETLAVLLRAEARATKRGLICAD